MHLYLSSSGFHLRHVFSSRLAISCSFLDFSDRRTPRGGGGGTSCRNQASPSRTSLASCQIRRYIYPRNYAPLALVLLAFHTSHPKLGGCCLRRHNPWTHVTSIECSEAASLRSSDPPHHGSPSKMADYKQALRLRNCVAHDEPAIKHGLDLYTPCSKAIHSSSIYSSSSVTVQWTMLWIQ